MKAPVVNRIVAKIIDIAVVLLIGQILPFVFGPLAGFFYSLFADGLPFKGWEGQSVGKKLMNLRVVLAESDRPIGFKESVVRNSPVGLATFFAIIPVWGWIILFLVGVPLMAMEIYLMARMETGHRLGDVMADTEVRTVGWSEMEPGVEPLDPEESKPKKKKTVKKVASAESSETKNSEEPEKSEKSGKPGKENA